MAISAEYSPWLQTATLRNCTKIEIFIPQRNRGLYNFKSSQVYFLKLPRGAISIACVNGPYVYLWLNFQWKETNSGQLMDSKLRCVFVVDENSSGDIGIGNNDGGHEYSTAKADIAAVKAQPVSASPKVSVFSKAAIFIKRKSVVNGASGPG